jgi:hypothetical protein
MGFRLKDLRRIVIAAKSTSADGGDEEPKRRLGRDEIGLKGSQFELLVGPDCRCGRDECIDSVVSAVASSEEGVF